ncbi:hypothetical protein HAX54_034838 [Datura stramonium]|uniref:Uncharacterized protein n=1 Tax=Datura stramonium TaxID=4076 RepID=A0ABS8SEL6_DATST|nr:hypothetical protein [Datura stramonium]
MAIQASLETANADGRMHDTSSNRRVVSDQKAATNVDDLLIPPFESLTTDSEPASRYLQAVSQISRNSQLEESSFPPLAVPSANSQPRPQSDALPKNTMASHLRRKQSKSKNPPSSSPAWPATTGHTPPIIGHQRAWPVISSASGSSSNSRQGSGQIRPSIAADGPPSSSYLNSVAARSSLAHESSSSSAGSSRSWAQSNRISHSLSAPNLIQSGSFDSSTPDFPPVSAVQTRKLPASGQQAATNVEDGNLRRISSRFNRCWGPYLAYVEQFGLSHLVLELARLCPDAEAKALIGTYNANFVGTVPIQNSRSGGNSLKDGKSSKNGKGKSIDAGNVTSMDNMADNVISTVRKLQSSHKTPEGDVEVLSRDGYRSAKEWLRLLKMNRITGQGIMMGKASSGKPQIQIGKRTLDEQVTLKVCLCVVYGEMEEQLQHERLIHALAKVSNHGNL